MPKKLHVLGEFVRQHEPLKILPVRVIDTGTNQDELRWLSCEATKARIGVNDVVLTLMRGDAANGEYRRDARVVFHDDLVTVAGRGRLQVKRHRHYAWGHVVERL